MKVLVAVFAVLAVFASVECGYIGGGHGGGGGGGAGGLETPVVHAGPVVTKVFGPPPAPIHLPGPPIPDHGYDRYVIHKPSPAIVLKGHGGYHH